MRLLSLGLQYPPQAALDPYRSSSNAGPMSSASIGYFNGGLPASFSFAFSASRFRVEIAGWTK